jgi:hypothetical protein
MPAKSANIIAALWPARCKAMVSVSGYLIGSPEAGKMPLPPKAELQWRYQFYLRPIEDEQVTKAQPATRLTHSSALAEMRPKLGASFAPDGERRKLYSFGGKHSGYIP